MTVNPPKTRTLRDRLRGKVQTAPAAVHDDDTRTKLGRSLFATGANSRAADYALISTRRVWTTTFAFSAIASALVGLLIGGFAGTISDGLGDPYLFQSVVAVIVGGTVFGGPGDYTRTCVGALFLTVLTTVLVGHGASPARPAPAHKKRQIIR